MARFGTTSLKRMCGCHPLLKLALHEAIKWYDFSIQEDGGWRNKATQNRLFAKGASKLQWPHGNHCYTATDRDVLDGFADKVGDPLSLAVDVAPYYPDLPHIRWKRTNEFIYLAGIIVGVGMPIMSRHGFKLRLGINWDGDQELVTDQRFQDYGHIEMVRV